MQRLWNYILAAIVFGCIASYANTQDPPGRIPGLVGNFKTGAKPTPRHVLIASPRFIPTRSVPTQVAYVPSKLSYWKNDTYGDCVTAEEAFAKAATGIFISDETVVSWAKKGGFLNGANLDEVLKAMASSGFSQDGNTYNDGGASVVDYSNESVLQAALAQGVVKIGIDSSALPSGAGNKSGWVALGGSRQFNNEDHSVSLAGFGTAQYLFSQIQVTLPSTLPPTTPGYLLFTWNTIGFVDHKWIMSTVGEAWVRNPTTIIVGTNPPSPDPPLNPPTPVPPVPVPPVPIPPIPPVPPPSPGVTTIAVSNTLGAGTYEVSPAGTASGIAAALATIQQLAALSVPPTPAPTPGSLEARMTAAEKKLDQQGQALDKIIQIVSGIQSALTGKQ